MTKMHVVIFCEEILKRKRKNNRKRINNFHGEDTRRDFLRRNPLIERSKDIGKEEQRKKKKNKENGEKILNRSYIFIIMYRISIYGYCSIIS